ncbi:MAG: tyrosine-type recombinase/integrase [Saprospiraceae bacterium]
MKKVLSNFIQLSKIIHRGETRIKVQFDRSDNFISIIKSIPHRRWSQTKRCWHLPYSKESFEQLKLGFGEAALKYVGKNKPMAKTEANIIERKLSEVSFATFQVDNTTKKKVVGEKVIIQEKDSAWLKAYVPVDKKGWVLVINNINGRKWQPGAVHWEIPNVKQSYRYLKKHIGLKNIQFDFSIKSNIPEEYTFQSKKKDNVKKVKAKVFDRLIESQRSAIFKLVDQMTLVRLSHSTIKSYQTHLAAIFLFYKKVEPEKISKEQVQKYILHQIKFKKVSVSTQNSIINSVKAYWEKVLKLPPTKIDIPRPKKPKHLPNVFSQEEVIQLVEAPENLKHKLVLLLIYSAGLRLSELINIRVRDISLKRRVIFIKDGKGKKDRFVTLAEEVVPYLATYKKEYRPDYWLIEGQSGGQYSKSSVQRIFRKALETSKVFAYGTVHTLRHSYATHCIENGFSTALLQEALGHGSIKTTEKYLHISSKALKKLRSPLDMMKEIKRK